MAAYLPAVIAVAEGQARALVKKFFEVRAPVRSNEQRVVVDGLEQWFELFDEPVQQCR